MGDVYATPQKIIRVQMGRNCVRFEKFTMRPELVYACFSRKPLLFMILKTVRSDMKNLAAAIALLLAYGSTAFCQPYYGHGSDVNIGGKIVKITSLADSGPGTLRACTDLNYPRVCVFETSGRIDARSALRIKNNKCYIAGQTAPSPGILITGSTVRVEASDVVVQHLQLRPGDISQDGKPGERDALAIGVDGKLIERVVADHLSLSFGIDENVSTYGQVQKVSVINSIVSEGLYKSVHPKGPHGYSVLLGVGTSKFTFQNNLIASSWYRNPQLNKGAVGDFLGNFIYNIGGVGVHNSMYLEPGASALSVNNVFKLGPSSPAIAQAIKGETNTALRVSGTKLFGKDGKLLCQDCKCFVGSTGSACVPAPLSAAPVFNPSQVGSRPWDRNAIDTRILAEVASGKGSIKNSVLEAGGYPYMPVNRRAISAPAELKGEALATWLRTFER